MRGRLVAVGVVGWLGGWILAALPCDAAPLRIGAAANLRGTLDRIVEQFERENGGSAEGISITFGSSGKLYAQIVHGAPFDLFFSADAKHAVRLEQEGLALAESRFTYALGQLVLWSADSAPERRLTSGDFEHLAIASPRVAPYGRAAREVLEAKGLWSTLESRLVYGEDIGKTFHFVENGAAELGFVPLSLVRRAPGRGESWLIPQTLYSPLEQQAVQLTRHEDASHFLEFVRGEVARATLETQGYAMPSAPRNDAHR